MMFKVGDSMNHSADFSQKRQSDLKQRLKLISASMKKNKRAQIRLFDNRDDFQKVD
jgi:hypothetical protein